MKGSTHLLGGAAAAFGLAAAASTAAPLPGLSVPQVVASITLCMLGSLLPDVDLPTSTLGRRLKPVSVPLNKLLGHRGFCHSLLFLCLPLILARSLAPSFLWAAMSLSAGIASHLILDVFNHAGEALLWPWNKRFHIIGIEIGSVGERILAVVLFCWTAAQLILTVIMDGGVMYG